MANYKSTIDFIRNLYGNHEFTPLAVPKFLGNEKAYLNECIDTTFVSSVGKFVDRFEQDMARYTGAKRAVVCVSGTNALHMALLLSGVKQGDEVLTQALTFIATANALSYIGAHPVFIDVDAWDKLAELCGQYLVKGSSILVDGRLQMDSWEKDGVKHQKLKVRASTIKFLPKGDRLAAGASRPAESAAPAPAAPAPAVNALESDPDDIPF